MDAMLDIVRQAMSREFADLMPKGFSIGRIVEYDPLVHTAPNLWLDKRENPKAQYLVNLNSSTSTVPALGETVADAVKAAILKIEARHARAN